MLSRCRLRTFLPHLGGGSLQTEVTSECLIRGFSTTGRGLLARLVPYWCHQLFRCRSTQQSVARAGRIDRPLEDSPLLELLFIRADLIDRITLRLGLKLLLLGSLDIVLQTLTLSGPLRCVGLTASFSCSSSMLFAKALFPPVRVWTSIVRRVIGGLPAFKCVAKLGGQSLLVLKTHQQATFLIYQLLALLLVLTLDRLELRYGLL
jgi:hypothetical protein